MRYRVTLKIEEDGKAEDDPEVVKFVDAETDHEAITKGKDLVRVENPELNYRKIQFWATERIL